MLNISKEKWIIEQDGSILSCQFEDNYVAVNFDTLQLHVRQQIISSEQGYDIVGYDEALDTTHLISQLVKVSMSMGHDFPLDDFVAQVQSNLNKIPNHNVDTFASYVNEDANSHHFVGSLNVMLQDIFAIKESLPILENSLQDVPNQQLDQELNQIRKCISQIETTLENVSDTSDLSVLENQLSKSLQDIEPHLISITETFQ